jgi:hypothetical protein
MSSSGEKKDAYCGKSREKLLVKNASITVISRFGSGRRHRIKFAGKITVLSTVINISLGITLKFNP